MFGKPLLAHPSERGRVHTTWHAHSGDGDDRDRHDDEADDEQHRVLAVNRSLTQVLAIVAFLHSPVCALVHSREYVNAVASRDSPAAVSACKATVGTPWPICALGNSAVQPRRVLLWHATRVAQGRPDHRLGFGGVDGWPGRESELTIGLGCPRRRRLPPADRHDVAVERSSPNHVREHSGGTPMTDQTAILADPEARTSVAELAGARG
jgi:hypothetical protein